MIKHIYIKNFVLIEEAELDLQSGFSVFTGETGAGKSVLMDALSVLSADRASSSFVMSGKDKAVIEGTFDLSDDPHALSVLDEAGLECGDEVTFTREITSAGKSVSRIDRRIVTLSLMKDCLRDQIDIHGQRDTAYLLKVSSHIRLLDGFLKLDDLKKSVLESYSAWAQLLKEKEEALSSTYNENDAEYFMHQIREIDSASLREGEDEELAEKEKQYRAMRDSMEKFSRIRDLYDNISDDLYTLCSLVESLDEDSGISQLQKRISDCYYDFTDAVEQLKDMQDSFDMSEEEINELQERIYTIQKLKRRYGHTIRDILDTRDELEEKVKQITHKQEYLQMIDQKIDKAYKTYFDYASKLSEKRRKNSSRLDKAVLADLHDLMLDNALFRTAVTDAKPSRDGIDRVEFMISMNKAEKLKPLAEVASGGELSRLMLGLKRIFTSLQGIRTVIFDEIDTGVSGPVASAIGRKMKSISADTQVIAVTHLAQVAAHADRHYLVSKSFDGKRTITNIQELDEEERISQLALIAAGEITDLSRKAAKELYERSRS